jgi:hypothetical protein
MRCLNVLSLLALPVVAQAPESILPRLPVDAASVLVVRDVMPHVEAVLQSPQLRELLASTGELQQELLGMRFDPAALRRQLELFQSFVPVEASIAVSGPAMRALLQVGRGAALATLVAMTAKGDATALATARSRCQAALLAAPDVALVGSLRLRDERLAENWFDAAVEALEALPADPGVTVTVQDTVLLCELAPLQVRDGMLAGLLQQAKVVLPANWSPRWSIRLEQQGTELRLRLGAAAATGLSPSNLGPLWREGPQQIVFWRGEFGDVAKDCEADSELVEALLPAAEIVGAVGMLSQVGALLLQGSLLPRLTFGAGERTDDGLQFQQETDFGESLANLRAPVSPELVRVVMPAEGPFVVSSLTLDLLLAGVGQEVVIRALRRGRELPEELRAAFELLEREAPSVFAPGVVGMMRGTTWRDPDGSTLPLPAVAFVAKVKTGAAARSFGRAIGQLISRAAGTEAEVWREGNLGFGVPTMVLDPTHFEGLREMPAGIVLHWLLIEDLLVLSSDPALTKDVLARRRGEARVDLPRGSLSQWTVWRGADFVAVSEGLAAWGPRITMHSDMKLALPAIAAVMRHVDAFEWIGEIDGSVFRERMQMRVKPSAAK